MPPEQATSFSQQQWAAFVPPGRGKQWPWKNRDIAIFALVILSAISVATIVWASRHFENRLDSSARTDLATAGVSLDNLKFDWDYRNLSLTGEMPAGVGEQQITDILRATDNNGIRDISLQLTTVVQMPQITDEKGTIDIVATLLDGRLVLDGTVLSQAHSDTLFSAAVQAVGPDNVISQIVVSGLQDAIPGADQRIESFAASIAGLDGATAADLALSATDLRFNATVADENQLDELLRRRGNAGDVGLVISGDIIAKKSAPGGIRQVSAVKKGERITLSGVVISDSQKQSLYEAAVAVVGEALVDDQIEVVSGDHALLTDGKTNVLATAIGTVGKAIEARARLTVNEFDFDALVEYEEDTGPFYGVRQAAFDNDLQVRGEIQSRRISLAREVALLQIELDKLAPEIRENVVFQSSEFELEFDAKRSLDKIVDAMNLYQRPVVQIIGHTDSSGASEENELLSLKRASAVREYLEISGIDPLRLRAIGLGEGIPIASNDTDIGKKQNRRVEFSARSNF